MLVVDDHEMFLDGITRWLEGDGGIEIVATARSLQEASSVLKQRCPDVVLMDQQLPDGTGTQGARLTHDRCPDAKVVVLTGYATDEALVGALEAGCSGFVTKDQTLADAASAVRAAHAGEAIIAPKMLTRLLPRIRAKRPAAAAELTPREQEVLALLAEGLSTQEMAERLVLSLHTVRNHVQNLMTKLGARSKLEAVTKASKQGLIRFP